MTTRFACMFAPSIFSVQLCVAQLIFVQLCLQGGSCGLGRLSIPVGDHHIWICFCTTWFVPFFCKAGVLVCGGFPHRLMTTRLAKKNNHSCLLHRFSVQHVCTVFVCCTVFFCKPRVMASKAFRISWWPLGLQSLFAHVFVCALFVFHLFYVFLSVFVVDCLYLLGSNLAPKINEHQ